VGKAKTHVRRDGLGEMGSMLYALMLQLLCNWARGGGHETGGKSAKESARVLCTHTPYM
jgi:hypothetical protein